jgi:FkbM family methyltransferase
VLNKIDHLVSIEKKALWNVDTSLALQQIDYSHDGFHVMNGLTHGAVDMVNTITTEQIMMKYNMPRVNIFKIDVEGAEKTIFEDEQCKESFIPVTDNIIMEVHPAYISASEIINCLKSYRFNAEKISIEGQPIAVVAQRLLQLG